MPICGIEMFGSEVILALLDGSKTSFSPYRYRTEKNFAF
jgi:hypothetical protein